MSDVPIRLFPFHARLRVRWAARIELPDLGEPVGYGATPDEALRDLADNLTAKDIEQLRRYAEVDSRDALT